MKLRLTYCILLYAEINYACTCRLTAFLTLQHFCDLQLSGYENDFKMERQEKNKALSDHQKIIRERDQAIHSYEQLKKEHIGLRQNIERMYSQAQAQQQVKLLCDQYIELIFSFLGHCRVWTMRKYNTCSVPLYIIGFWTHKKKNHYCSDLHVCSFKRYCSSGSIIFNTKVHLLSHSRFETFIMVI